MEYHVSHPSKKMRVERNEVVGVPFSASCHRFPHAASHALAKALNGGGTGRERLNVCFVFSETVAEKPLRSWKMNETIEAGTKKRRLHIRHMCNGTHHLVRDYAPAAFFPLPYGSLHPRTFHLHNHQLTVS